MLITGTNITAEFACTYHQNHQNNIFLKNAQYICTAKVPFRVVQRLLKSEYYRHFYSKENNMVLCYKAFFIM